MTNIEDYKWSFKKVMCQATCISTTLIFEL